MELEGREPARRRRTRSDFLASREALIAAVEVLLATQDRPFSLAELAQQAGMSVATAYRHFTDGQQARDAYHARLLEELTARIAVAHGDDPRARLDEACRIWVRQAARGSRAAVRVRPPDGFLARYRRGDEPVVAFYDTLAPFVTALIDSGLLPCQPVDYAILMWITLFDERAILDLLATGDRTADTVADELTGSLLAVLTHPVAQPAVTPPCGT